MSVSQFNITDWFNVNVQSYSGSQHISPYESAVAFHSVEYINL